MRILAIFMVLAMGWFGSQSKRQIADIVLTNGVIHTVDEKQPSAQALAIAGDRIAFVGTNELAKAWIGDKTQVIDLGGKTVVPGFIDSHYHFQGVGQRAYNLNLDGCTSLEEFLSRLKNWAANVPAGEWIRGRGWMEEDWPVKQFPTRADLDRIVPNLPVYLNRADGHMAVVNSKALEIAGITASTANPPGGEILRDSKGQPNGLLVDKAMGLVTKHIPSSSPEMQEKFALKANEVALAYGLTTIHDAGSSWETVNLWKRLYGDGKMQVRIYEFIRGPGADVDTLLQNGAPIGLFDHHLTIRGIKISIDGALGRAARRCWKTIRMKTPPACFSGRTSRFIPPSKRRRRKGCKWRFMPSATRPTAKCSTSSNALSTKCRQGSAKFPSRVFASSMRKSSLPPIFPVSKSSG
jgi:predicted amidohydrolase YtcJ